MNDDRIAALEREVVRLRAEVADVRAAIKLQSDGTVKEFRIIYADLDAIKYRTLPEYAGVRHQIREVLGPDTPDPNSGTST